MIRYVKLNEFDVINEKCLHNVDFEDEMEITVVSVIAILTCVL